MKRTTTIFALMALPPTGATPDSKFPPKPDPAEIKARVDAAVAKVDAVNQAGPFKAEPDSLRKIGIPEWYADAKLGIFSHWGVYSVPAFGSEWYPRKMYGKDDWQKVNSHHVETWGTLSEFGYKDDIRFTTRDGKVYAFLMEWSGTTVTIKSLAKGNPHETRPVASVELVGGPKLTFTQTAAGLRIILPADPPTAHAHPLKISVR